MNGGKIKTMLSDAFNSIPFANTLTNPIVMAGMAGFKALQTGFEREKVQVAFDVLLRGDTKASEALREEIRQYGMVTPYMTAELQDAAKMMLHSALHRIGSCPTSRRWAISQWVTGTN